MNQIKGWWGFTVDDVGLDGYSTEEDLQKILDFLDELQISATFFVVPEVDGKKMNNRTGYIKVLRDAVRRGHEIAQHGITHDRFEVGIPPEMILRLPHEGPARAFLAEHRNSLSEEHTVEKIRAKLSLGRQILEDAIGIEIHGFRAPALQSCDNLFIALAEENYSYDSSTWFQTSGWDLMNGIESQPVEITYSLFLQSQKPGLRELPLTTDYTWYLKQSAFDKEYVLAVHDFNCCMYSKIPFVTLIHVSPVLEGGSEGTGFTLYRKLMQYIRTWEEEKGYLIQSLPLEKISQFFPWYEIQ